MKFASLKFCIDKFNRLVRQGLRVFILGTKISNTGETISNTESAKQVSYRNLATGNHESIYESL